MSDKLVDAFRELFPVYRKLLEIGRLADSFIEPGGTGHNIDEGRLRDESGKLSSLATELATMLTDANAEGIVRTVTGALRGDACSLRDSLGRVRDIALQLPQSLLFDADSLAFGSKSLGLLLDMKNVADQTLAVWYESLRSNANQDEVARILREGPLAAATEKGQGTAVEPAAETTPPGTGASAPELVKITMTPFAAPAETRQWTAAERAAWCESFRRLQGEFQEAKRRGLRLGVLLIAGFSRAAPAEDKPPGFSHPLPWLFGGFASYIGCLSLRLYRARGSEDDERALSDLATEAGRLIQNSPPSVTADIDLYPNANEAMQWAYVVFALSWKRRRGTSLQARRLVWWNCAECAAHELASLRELEAGRPNGDFAELIACTPDPPDRWYSTIDDLVSASVAAIDILLSLAAASPPPGAASAGLNAVAGSLAKSMNVSRSGPPSLETGGAVVLGPTTIVYGISEFFDPRQVVESPFWKPTLRDVRSRLVDGAQSGKALGACLVNYYKLPNAKEDSEQPPGIDACAGLVHSFRKMGFLCDADGNRLAATNPIMDGEGSPILLPDGRPAAFVPGVRRSYLVQGDESVWKWFQRIAVDASRCLSGMPQTVTQVVWREMLGGFGLPKDGWFWIIAVFELALQELPAAALHTKRFAWNGNVKVLFDMLPSLKKAAVISTEIPRTRWYATLDDLVQASINAVDVMMTLADTTATPASIPPATPSTQRTRAGEVRPRADSLGETADTSRSVQPGNEPTVGGMLGQTALAWRGLSVRFREILERHENAPHPATEVQTACIDGAKLLANSGGTARAPAYMPAPNVFQRYPRCPKPNDWKAWAEIWELSLFWLLANHPFAVELSDRTGQRLLAYNPWKFGSAFCDPDWRAGVERFSVFCDWYCEYFEWCAEQEAVRQSFIGHPEIDEASAVEPKQVERGERDGSAMSVDGAARSVFDVFLSHNSEDKPLARTLKQKLEQWGLRAWLDEESLPGGQPWQEVVEPIIRTVLAAAVLIGPSGMGPWQRKEVSAFVEEDHSRGLPVIPVFLRGIPQDFELPWWLRDYTVVDLQGGFDEDGLTRLVRAINSGPTDIGARQGTADATRASTGTDSPPEPPIADTERSDCG